MSIIYILTNPAFDGYVKIGKTTNLKQRLRSLDNTSIPLPFRCAYAARVTNVDSAEKLLHDAFGDRRVRDNREFFEIDPLRVISALKLAGGVQVTPLDDIAADEAGVEAANRSTKRQSSFNFEIVDIPVGSILTFSEDDTVSATVHNRRKVAFEGEVMSLSVAALTVIKRSGRNWRAAAGPLYWVYDGETLNERRARIEREATEADDD
jgi:hypothetical protein